MNESSGSDGSNMPELGMGWGEFRSRLRKVGMDLESFIFLAGSVHTRCIAISMCYITSLEYYLSWCHEMNA